KVYAIYGPKFVALEEDVNFNYNIIGAPPPPQVAAAVVPGALAAGDPNMFDDFHCRNLFFGGQLGVYVIQKFGQVVGDLQLKCALGWNYNNIWIAGSNDSPVVGGLNTQVYTNRTNIGFFESNSFGVIPEIDGNLAYNVTPRIQIRAGYSFLLWTSVVRPGNQMAPLAGPVLAGVVGSAPFNTSTFIIHAMNFGAVWKY